MVSIIITIISGVLGGGAFAFVQFLIVRHDDKMHYLTGNDLNPVHKDIGLLKDANLVMMRDMIVRDCKKYLEDGQIGVMEASVLTDMVAAYEKLGGNGFAKELFKLVKKLPFAK